jgi:hypothetical protein
MEEIRDNLEARIAEAQREGWLAQIDMRSRTGTAVDLGVPTIRTKQR